MEFYEFSWHSINSIKFHGFPWHSIEFQCVCMVLHSIGWYFVSTMEFHLNPWDSMKFHWMPMDFPVNLMEFDGISWNCMEFHWNSLAIPMGFHVSSWNSRAFHEMPWYAMGFNGIPWNSMKSKGIQWIPVKPDEIQWNPMKSNANQWTPMASCGILWHHMESWQALGGNAWVNSFCDWYCTKRCHSAIFAIIRKIRGPGGPHIPLPTTTPILPTWRRRRRKNFFGSKFCPPDIWEAQVGGLRTPPTPLLGVGGD